MRAARRLHGGGSLLLFPRTQVQFPASTPVVPPQPGSGNTAKYAFFFSDWETETQILKICPLEAGEMAPLVSICFACERPEFVPRE